MRLRRPFPILVALAGATVLAAAAARQAGVGVQSGHRLMDRYLGTWKATVTLTLPEMGTVDLDGSETNKLGPGGRWMVTDLQFEYLGGRFEGHGLLGYDPRRDTYESCWVDSVDDFLKLAEGSWDERTATLQLEREFSDETGQRVVERIEDRFVDANTRQVTIRETVAGAEPIESMRILLRRH